MRPLERHLSVVCLCVWKREEARQAGKDTWFEDESTTPARCPSNMQTFPSCLATTSWDYVQTVGHHYMTPLHDSTTWIHYMTPLHDSTVWPHYMTPLHDSTTWLLCMTPLHDSSAWLQCMNPLHDSTTWHRTWIHYMTILHDSTVLLHCKKNYVRKSISLKILLFLNAY